MSQSAHLDEPRQGLTKQSLSAAAIAAYAGSVLMFAMDLTRRIFIGSDADMCSAGHGGLTLLCHTAEGALAYLATLYLAVFAFPVALVLCLPVAWELSRFAPVLERTCSKNAVRQLQYALATVSGAAVMIVDDMVSGVQVDLLSPMIGAITGAIAVLVFRRSRYRTSAGPTSPSPAP